MKENVLIVHQEMPMRNLLGPRDIPLLRAAGLLLLAESLDDDLSAAWRQEWGHPCAALSKSLPSIDGRSVHSFTSDGLPTNTTVKKEVGRSFRRAMNSLIDFSQESNVGLPSQDRLQIDGNVTVLKQLDSEQDVLCICYTEARDFLAAGLTDGTIKLFKMNSDVDVLTLRDTEIAQKPSPTTAVQHRPAHKSHPIKRTVTATYANGCVKCWHYPSCQCLYTIREKRQTLGLTYHSHLPKFVTTGDDAKLYLYDEETNTLERIFQASDSLEVMDGHKSRVFCACFNPKSAHELISGGWDDTIQFWDTRQPYALRRISGVHMCGDGLDITKNGKEILSCAWQRQNPIQLWDYGSGKLLVSLEPDSYSSLLYCGKYVTNMFLACGGTDVNLFRVIDLRSHATLAMIRNLNGGTYSMDIGPVNPRHAKKTKTAAVVPQIAFCAGRRIFEIDAQPG